MSHENQTVRLVNVCCERNNGAIVKIEMWSCKLNFSSYLRFKSELEKKKSKIILTKKVKIYQY